MLNPIISNYLAPLFLLKVPLSTIWPTA